MIWSVLGAITGGIIVVLLLVIFGTPLTTALACGGYGASMTVIVAGLVEVFTNAR